MNLDWLFNDGQVSSIFALLAVAVTAFNIWLLNQGCSTRT